jgi:hypothetical protein
MEVWNKYEYEYQGKSLIDDANPVFVFAKNFKEDPYSMAKYRLLAIVSNTESPRYICESGRLVDPISFRYVEPVNGL